MKPNCFLSIALPVLIVVSVALDQARATDTSSAKPNMVIFISDDHGQADAEPYGATDLRTPNMAKLAASGMRFNHAYVASPACGPSRTALLTGLWPARNGAEPNHKNKRPDVASLPPRLHDMGYEVVAIGKVAHNDFAKSHGFDQVIRSGPGLTSMDEVKRFLDERNSEKPLCLFVGTRHPHVPWSEPEGYRPEAMELPPTFVDTPETRTVRTRYATDVSKSDQLLGELRAMVREKIPGSTLFIYTADHGPQWPFSKWNLYDAGIRIPLLMEWPGHIQPGTESNAMVCWPDLLPTMIELAGGEAPQGIDGKSFAAVVRGTATTHREQVFSTHSGDGDFNVYPIRSVRSAEWKYIRNLYPELQHQTHITRRAGTDGSDYWPSWLEKAKSDASAATIVKRYSERPAEELYHVSEDRWEQTNLVDDPAAKEVLAKLRGELDLWMKQQGDTQAIFGTPLRLGDPVTMLSPANKKNQPSKKAVKE